MSTSRGEGLTASPRLTDTTIAPLPHRHRHHQCCRNTPLHHHHHRPCTGPQPQIYSPPTPQNLGTSIPAGVNTAREASTVAIGYQATALERTAMAFGFNVEAQSSGSLATGMYTKTYIDKTTPTKHSAGGSTAMGFGTMAIGDFSMATNSNTTARGYCSTAMGEGTEAKAFGELAAGLYTENDGPYTNAYPVIPSSTSNASYPWPEGAQYGSPTSAQILLNKDDAVLRIGIGQCEEYGTNPASPYWNCKKAKRMDGLRLHRNGRLYLRKADGSKIEDVQETIMSLQSRIAAIEGNTISAAAPTTGITRRIWMVVVAALLVVLFRTS